MHFGAMMHTSHEEMIILLLSGSTANALSLAHY